MTPVVAGNSNKCGFRMKGSVLPCGLLECHGFSYVGFWEKGCSRGQGCLLSVVGICTLTRIKSVWKFPGDKTASVSDNAMGYLDGEIYFYFCF